jgi:hypothetical protein
VGVGLAWRGTSQRQCSTTIRPRSGVVAAQNLCNDSWPTPANSAVPGDSRVHAGGVHLQDHAQPLVELTPQPSSVRVVAVSVRVATVVMTRSGRGRRPRWGSAGLGLRDVGWSRVPQLASRLDTEMGG